jgi:hypothetical protein
MASTWKDLRTGIPTNTAPPPPRDSSSGCPFKQLHDDIDDDDDDTKALLALGTKDEK